MVVHTCQRDVPTLDLLSYLITPYRTNPSPSFRQHKFYPDQPNALLCCLAFAFVSVWQLPHGVAYHDARSPQSIHPLPSPSRSSPNPTPRITSHHTYSITSTHLICLSILQKMMPHPLNTILLYSTLLLTVPSCIISPFPIVFKLRCLTEKERYDICHSFNWQSVRWYVHEPVHEMSTRVVEHNTPPYNSL